MMTDPSREIRDQLIEFVDKLVASAWAAGFKAGGEAMRDSILRAVHTPAPPSQSPVSLAPPYPAPPPQAPVSPAPVSPAGETSPGHSGTPAGPRAPRGSVGRTIDGLLADRPEGILISELEKVASAAEGIAIKSVGNELRRYEGKKYRRDRPGGHRWFLIGTSDQKGGATGAGASAADSIIDAGEF
jgi:hypothetical protein